MKSNQHFEGHLPPIDFEFAPFKFCFQIAGLQMLITIGNYNVL